MDQGLDSANGVEDTDRLKRNRGTKMLGLLVFAGAAALVQAQVRAEPIESPGAWLSNADYPAAAIRRRAQGEVGFRLTVGASGQPTACTIISPSNDESLDQVTCALVLSRARFRPARNANGLPVEDTYVSRVRWAVDERDFLIGIEPVRVVNFLRAEPFDLVTCQIVLEGPRTSSAEGFGCDIDFSHDQVRRFARRFRGRVVEVADSIGYAPEPGPAPAPTAEPLGNLYARTEVRITVSPSGNVVGCQTIRRSRIGSASGPTPPDVCPFYRRNYQPMFAAAPGQADRTIRATHEYHLRVIDPGSVAKN